MTSTAAPGSASSHLGPRHSKPCQAMTAHLKPKELVHRLLHPACRTMGVSVVVLQNL